MTGDLHKQAEGLLRRALGDQARFHSGQFEAIEAIVATGGRHLVVQRTGWGKSTVYFVATKIHREQGKGPTLIISPLLALTRDQIRNARHQFGLRVDAINSTTTQDHAEILSRWKKGEIDLLFITPERLKKKAEFEAILDIGRIGLFVVDEAHCISDWGHDFRPDFRRIIGFLKHLGPDVPVLCTTATANERVVQDIKEQVGTVSQIRGSLARKSLYLDVLRLPSHAERMAWLALHVDELPGSGIIYTLTRRDAELVADWLRDKGLPVAAYHSKMDEVDKVTMEQALLDNRLKALVATTALGMGFDKPDMGFVVHFQRPSGVVALYQQIGRAGRAISEARCILMCGAEDGDIHASLRESSFPRTYEMEKIVRLLEDSDGLPMATLQRKTDIPLKRVQHALRHLEIDGAVDEYYDGERWIVYRTPNRWEPDPDRVQQIITQREQEWAQLEQVVDGELCLLQGVTRALDDPVAVTECGQCSACRRPEFADELAPSDVAEAQKFYQEKPIVIQPRKRWCEITGKRPQIRATERFEPGRALCKYMDAGWGRLVVQGKYNDQFYSDELVQAAGELINARWKELPRVTHLVPVPNRGEHGAVAHFSRRLAEVLGLPVFEPIERIETGKAQKDYQTSEHQLGHAREAYSLTGSVPERATILLVDDLVDSRWTFTVIASMLKNAGADKVFPFALADAVTTT